MLKNQRKSPFTKSAQTAVEYMLLLGVVVSIVMIGMKIFTPRVQSASEGLFNKQSRAVAGKPNPCGDGCCSSFEDARSCDADCCPSCISTCP